MFSFRLSLVINRFFAGLSFATLLSAGAHAGLKCRSDLDGNGVVNRADLQFTLDRWGTGKSSADLNGDGVIDGMDLGIALAAFGPCDFNNCSQRSVLSDPKLAAKIFGGLKIPGTETGLSLPGPRDPRTLKESSK